MTRLLVGVLRVPRAASTLEVRREKRCRSVASREQAGSIRVSPNQCALSRNNSATRFLAASALAVLLLEAFSGPGNKPAVLVFRFGACSAAGCRRSGTYSTVHAAGESTTRAVVLEPPRFGSRTSSSMTLLGSALRIPVGVAVSGHRLPRPSFH